jgi:hypothetical protein
VGRSLDNDHVGALDEFGEHGYEPLAQQSGHDTGGGSDEEAAAHRIFYAP